VPRRTKTLTAAVVRVSLGVIAVALLSQLGFELWWYALQEAATAPADRSWLADHDGGGPIIVFMSTVLKAGVLWTLALAITAWRLPREKSTRTIPTEGAESGRSTKSA
jgi:hypothetical protein